MPVPNSIAARHAEHREWRRDFHRHPEIAYQEVRTARLVAERLRAFGCDEVLEGVAGTGVVGVIHGRQERASGGASGRAGDGTGDETGDDARDGRDSVLLRADMDALPMRETGAIDHASTIDGAMHACGHDGHTTMLLAAAQHLAETRAFKGRVVLCFQPAEEQGAGAAAMLRDGLLDRFPCREAYAMHTAPGLPLGAFALRPGPICAAAQDFKITVTGDGGHAALPHLAADTILAAGQLVTSLHALVSRRVNPFEQAVLSLTSIHGGASSNVLPDQVELIGTVRSLDDGVRDQLLERMHAVAAGLASAQSVEIAIDLDPDAYPATVNTTRETEFARSVAEEIAGPGRVETVDAQMGSEDFSFLLRRMPGAFVLIGNGDSAPLHHSQFDFDDRAIPYGAAFFARLVERALPLD